MVARLAVVALVHVATSVGCGVALVLAAAGRGGDLSRLVVQGILGFVVGAVALFVALGAWPLPAVARALAAWLRGRRTDGVPTALDGVLVLAPVAATLGIGGALLFGIPPEGVLGMGVVLVVGSIALVLGGGGPVAQLYVWIVGTLAGGES
jgi:hypothetical protein